MAKKWILVAAAIVVVGFGLIQLIPYRITNPAPRVEPHWDSPRTRALAVRACFDCHSNETHKPWYTMVAPISWWTRNHVDEGRAALNFSEWNGHHGEADDAAETVTEGSMPPDYYLWLGLHSDAHLTAAEKRELADGLRRTFANG
jgi:hypothetical protein